MWTAKKVLIHIEALHVGWRYGVVLTSFPLWANHDLDRKWPCHSPRYIHPEFIPRQPFTVVISSNAGIEAIRWQLIRPSSGDFALRRIKKRGGNQLRSFKFGANWQTARKLPQAQPDCQIFGCRIL